MNLKNVKKLRDFIAKLPPDAISMSDYIDLDQPNETTGRAAKQICGTRACIAGWACLALLPGKTKFEENETYNPMIIRDGQAKYISIVAQELLDLSDDERADLFEGGWTGKQLSAITKRDVLRKLDSMLKTGKV